MANDLNQCSFIGRLGADPEGRALANGDAVSSFRIAVGWKTKEKEGAEWVPVVAFGKLAEICNDYLQKGGQVFVQGRFRTRKWTDKEGIDRYTTEIIAETIQMLSRASGDTNPQGNRHTSNQGSRRSESGHSGGGGNDGNSPAPRKPPPSFDDLGDDLPFEVAP